VFNRITQAVRRAMLRAGFEGTVAYLDDFFVCGTTFERCLEAYNYLIHLLRSLGFQINWQKICDPSQRITFLGIVIDSSNNILTLNREKVESLCTYLENFPAKTKRRQMESLAGKLSWAANVVPWGRAFIRPIFTMLSNLSGKSCVQVTPDIRRDLRWWSHCLRNGTNSRRIWDGRPVIKLQTDASLVGGGAICQNDWTYVNWLYDFKEIAREHINVKELAMVLMAAKRWAHSWAGHRIMVESDNAVTVSAINKGTTMNSVCLLILKEIAELSIAFNFSLFAIHIPGIHNCLADCLSRFHDSKMITQFFFDLRYNGFVYLLHNHMSYHALMSISQQIRDWLVRSHSWTEK